MKALTTVLTLFFFSPSSQAWFPEYEHLSDRESNEINGPRLIGSEYESDRLTYQFLSSWNLDWLNNNQVFQYTAGSLGPTRFYTRGRMRLRKKINELWDFQLAYTSLGDASTDRQSLIFEFYFKTTSWLHLSIYGEPSTLKKQDDLGLAATFLFSSQSELRVYYTWVDFSHNKRNELSDRYTKKPASAGIVWRQNKKDSFIQTSVRHDLNTEQSDAGTAFYHYGGTFAGWQSRHAIDDSRSYFLQTEFNLSKTYESSTVNPDSNINRWEKKHIDGLLQINTSQSFVDLYGIRAVHSMWSSTLGHVVHNDLLPHLWMKPWSWRSGKQLHRIDLGYEFTWHRGQGPMALRSTLDRNDVLEHRMNWRYSFFNSENTRMNLLLTFDLDKFGSGETWEGGSMQFSTVF